LVDFGKVKQGDFSGLFYVLYSTLLHLAPLSFYFVGGCWDRIPRTVATVALAVRKSYAVFYNVINVKMLFKFTV
jgi:hypothetical protein